ncbi:unnamed protein product, partial [Choristocarpus tenellus]
YIPFWALGLDEGGVAGAHVFRRKRLANRLDIPVELLPTLACLVGNDWIDPGDHCTR